MFVPAFYGQSPDYYGQAQQTQDYYGQAQQNLDYYAQAQQTADYYSQQTQPNQFGIWSAPPSLECRGLEGHGYSQPQNVAPSSSVMAGVSHGLVLPPAPEAAALPATTEVFSMSSCASRKAAAALEPVTSEMLEMDQVLREAFLKAAKKGVRAPLKGTILYTKHMRSCRAPGTSVDVKDSSFRYLAKFLESLEQQGLLLLKPGVTDPVVLQIHTKAVMSAPIHVVVKPSVSEALVSKSFEMSITQKGQAPSAAAGTMTPTTVADASEPSMADDMSVADEMMRVVSKDFSCASDAAGETGTVADEMVRVACEAVGFASDAADETGSVAHETVGVASKAVSFASDAVDEASSVTGEIVRLVSKDGSSSFSSCEVFSIDNTAVEGGCEAEAPCPPVNGDVKQADVAPEACETSVRKVSSANVESTATQAAGTTCAVPEAEPSYRLAGDFQATATYAAADEVELSIEKGEDIYVTQVDEEGWALATTVPGKQGLVPFNKLRRQVYLTPTPFTGGPGYTPLGKDDFSVVYHREGEWSFGARVQLVDGKATFVGEGWFPSPASPLPAFPPPSLMQVPPRPPISQ